MWLWTIRIEGLCLREFRCDDKMVNHKNIQIIWSRGRNQLADWACKQRKAYEVGGWRNKPRNRESLNNFLRLVLGKAPNKPTPENIKSKGF